VVPLLAPVADKLGIDLIWFGVLLGVNMQTSFMHPPFGFALFYLRSVAPTKEYTDRLTKKVIQPVTTMQIYWGAVPFVVIQIVMVGLIIAFPGIVSRDVEQKVDLDKVQKQLQIQMQEYGPGAAVPGTPAASAASGAEAMPNPAEEQKSADEEQRKLDELFKK
jgi:GntP family gluconate:H+ symporter